LLSQSSTGDLDADNDVDIFDLLKLLSKWGTNDANTDLNGSGNVDIFDLLILLQNWGTCACGSWQNKSCGGGSCSANELYQTRTCTPSGCAKEERCTTPPSEDCNNNIDDDCDGAIDCDDADCASNQACTLPSGKLPVFPGAVGFGVETPAGSGRHLDSPETTVYKITNLKNSGSGSLRACVEASGPRVCVFEVSGNIDLGGNLQIENPYITIAGQTAPSPGISLIKGQLTIKTHDVLIQHIRVRLGDKNGEKDTIQINRAKNVVLDHVSASWSVDGTVDVVYYSDYVTIINSIMSEALYNSVHSEKPHSRSMLISRATNVAIIQDLFAHNNMRNPETSKEMNSFFMANTLVYNYGKYGAMVGKTDPDNKVAIVNNAFLTGPSTKSGYMPITIWNQYKSKVYVDGNSLDGNVPSDPWDLVLIKASTPDPKLDSPPLWPNGYVPMSVEKVKDFILQNVGARPADRDAVDKRIINDVKNRTGKLIDSQDEVGGWPDLAQNKRSLTLPDNPNGRSNVCNDQGECYTNLEVWLQKCALDVEIGGNRCTGGN